MVVKISKQKAQKILSEGVARGKKITDKQRKFFGAIASGKRPRRSKK